MSLGCPYYNPNNPAKPKNLKAKTTPKQPSAKNNAQPPFAAQWYLSGDPGNYQLPVLSKL